MKIVIDSFPRTPADCPFSLYDPRIDMHVCQLRPYREEAYGKPKCVCKHVDKCDQLVEISQLIKEGILT